MTKSIAISKCNKECTDEVKNSSFFVSRPFRMPMLMPLDGKLSCAAHANGYTEFVDARLNLE